MDEAPRYIFVYDCFCEFTLIPTAILVIPAGLAAEMNLAGHCVVSSPTLA